METDKEFFNKPTCPNCGSPHIYPCPYCMPIKEYKKEVRRIKLMKITAIALQALVPIYAYRRFVK